MTEIITIRPLVPQPSESRPIAESVQEEASLSPYQARQVRAPEIASDDFFGSFADILDVINPLQHIPVVSTIYRELTGSTISPGARIAGDTLFGGPLGLIAGIIGSIVEGETGKDLGANVVAAVTDKYEKTSQLG